MPVDKQVLTREILEQTELRKAKSSRYTRGQENFNEEIQNRSAPKKASKFQEAEGNDGPVGIAMIHIVCKVEPEGQRARDQLSNTLYKS